jgi:hypothetical protein
VITFSSYLESVLNELRGLPEAEAFLFPVNHKAVSNYYEVIKRPMDLQTVREAVQQRKFHSREEFLQDINQMVENSAAFNGETSILTINSKVRKTYQLLPHRNFCPPGDSGARGASLHPVGGEVDAPREDDQPAARRQ